MPRFSKPENFDNPRECPLRQIRLSPSQTTMLREVVDKGVIYIDGRRLPSADRLTDFDLITQRTASPQHLDVEALAWNIALRPASRGKDWVRKHK